MKIFFYSILAIGAMCGVVLASGGPPKPLTHVRLLNEGNERDGESFVSPVEVPMMNDKRLYMAKAPVFTERNISKILPFAVDDGSLGCIFQLDFDGQQRVEEATTSHRDKVVLGMINGRVGCAMRVDKRITDGIVTIAGGFRPEEIIALQATFPTMGKEKEFKEQKKEALAAIKRKWEMDREALKKEKEKEKK